MVETHLINLAEIFHAVSVSLENNRTVLNQADPYNGNHGDHMVEIFNTATQAAREKPGAGLAEAMDYAGSLLAQLDQNGSAQVYARGLAQFARQFQKYLISLDDLIFYVQGLINEEKSSDGPSPQTRTGDVLKALVSGLAGWPQSEAGSDQAPKNLDMGYLFDLGISYMQAKQRGGSKTDILADAAASASPLNSVPHRYLSGKIALSALLQALSASTT